MTTLPMSKRVVSVEIAKEREELFRSLVDVHGEDECWPFNGTRNKQGYGEIGGQRATHIALALDARPRPEGLMALHSCDNPPCCNPKHLRWGTHADNLEDMRQRRRFINMTKSHCKRGHEFTPENTAPRAGQRNCKICKRITNARRSKKPRLPKELQE